MSKRLPILPVITTGITLFTMLFGVGNLIFPVLVGYWGGTHYILTASSFILSAVCLPLAGLIGISLFNGDYEAFFSRLGKPLGSLLILLCMIILGPLVAMPRLIALTYALMVPFLPHLSFTLFAFVFLLITLITAYYQRKTVLFLMIIVGPLQLLGLMGIIAASLLTPGTVTDTSLNADILWKSFHYGMGTLDLIATIFFAAFVINALKQHYQANSFASIWTLISLRAGLITAGLLTTAYFGLAYLGAHHQYLIHQPLFNNIFSLVAVQAFGPYTGLGTYIVIMTLFVTGLSTLIALAVVTSNYVQEKIFMNRVSYQTALLFIATLTLIALYFNTEIFSYAVRPLIAIGYPLIITITLCNIAYKLFHFKPIKIPALMTFVAVVVFYLLRNF